MTLLLTIIAKIIGATATWFLQKEGEKYVIDTVSGFPSNLFPKVICMHLMTSFIRYGEQFEAGTTTFGIEIDINVIRRSCNPSVTKAHLQPIIVTGSTASLILLLDIPA